MQLRVQPRRIALALAASLLLAGCGGGDDAPPAGEGTAPATEDGGEGTEGTEAAGGDAPPVELSGAVNVHGTAQVSDDQLQMTLGDFFFEPTFVRAEPGAAVTVRMTNTGSAPHTFTIDSLGIDVQLDAGGEGEAVVQVPEDGALRFYCRFHEAQGMVGAFYTEPGQPVAD